MIKIIKEKNNPIFNRKEIVFELEANSTPSYKEIEKIVSDEFKTDPKKFKINKIKGKFGSRLFNIEVNIYNSEEDKGEIEFKSKKEKEAEAKPLEERKKTNNIQSGKSED